MKSDASKSIWAALTGLEGLKKREEGTKLSGQGSWTEVNPGWAINLITKPKTINFFKEM